MKLTDKRFWILMISIIAISCNNQSSKLGTETANTAQSAGNAIFCVQEISEEEYKRELNAMQNDWYARVAAVDSAQASRQALCDAIADEAEAFLDKWLKKAEETEGTPRGSEEFQCWWKGKNEELGKDRRIAW